MPDHVALLPWGDVIEDYLEPIGVPLDEFARSMTGGWLFNYVDAFRSQGIHSTIFCVAAGVAAVTRITNRGGADVCLLPAPRRLRALRAAGLTHHGPAGAPRAVRALTGGVASYMATPVRALVAELRSSACTAILCQEYEFPRFDVTVAIGRRLRLPVFGTFQGADRASSPLERPLRGRAVRHCAGLIVGPALEAERVRRLYDLPPDRIARIYNPLDADLWQPMERQAARARADLPTDALIVAWHGRIDIHRKGLDTLLAAWDILCTESAVSERILLVIVGSGADAGRFERQVRPRARVVWLNEYVMDRQRVREYLSAADVYAFSSRHEGFPVAPLEAMACGLPLVATDAPGVPDILQDGEDSGGLMVPRNDPRRLAAAIETFLVDPDRRARAAAAARRRVLRAFSLEAVGMQLAGLMRQRSSS